jgi:outer membrane protein assembly factor BamB
MRISIILLALLYACTGRSENWPQFRGTTGNPVIQHIDIPQEWDGEKDITWKYHTDGRGWSSPVIWDDRVFYTSSVLDLSVAPTDSTGTPYDPAANPSTAHYRMEIHCLNLEDGKNLWSRIAYSGQPRIPTHRDNTFASETPVTDGKRIYAYFGMTGLYCYNMEGDLLWEKDMGAYLTQSNWGTSTSPLIYGETLFMQIDSEDESYVVAIEGKSGKEIWRQTRDEKSNWSTPIIWKNHVRTELVTSGQTARAYNPETGAVLWSLHLGGGRNISSPVADEGLLFLGNEERRGSGGTLFAVKAGATGDITPEEGATSSSGVPWSIKKSGLSMASPLLYEGYIYIVDRRRGAIFCYAAKTGSAAYQNIRIPEAGPFWATPWAYDGKIFCLDEKGTTHVVQAGPEFKVLYQNKLDDKFWTSPAFSEGRIVLRGVEYIYCIGE